MNIINPNKGVIKKYLFIFIIVISIISISSFVMSYEANPENNAISIDLIWMLIAAFLVFMMQGGFAMLETGFT